MSTGEGPEGSAIAPAPQPPLPGGSFSRSAIRRASAASRETLCILIAPPSTREDATITNLSPRFHAWLANCLSLHAGRLSAIGNGRSIQRAQYPAPHHQPQARPQRQENCDLKQQSHRWMGKRLKRHDRTSNLRWLHCSLLTSKIDL